MLLYQVGVATQYVIHYASTKLYYFWSPQHSADQLATKVHPFAVNFEFADVNVDRYIKSVILQH